MLFSALQVHVASILHFCFLH